MKSVKKTVDVILTATHDHLGIEGSVVRVRSGFARNCLIPKGLALIANDAYKQIYEKSKARRASNLAEERKSYQTMSDKIAAQSVVFRVRVAESGKLYGAISNQTIAEELTKQSGKLVTKRKVLLAKPIKEPGIYDAELRLYPEIVAKLKIEVIKDDSVVLGDGPAERQRTRKKKRIDDLVLNPGAVSDVAAPLAEMEEVIEKEATAEEILTGVSETKKDPKKRANKKRSSESLSASESISA